MSETTSFVVHFARNDLPYLGAAALIDRKAIAWFDLDGSTVRLCVAGSHLGMTRPLRATVTNAGSGTPVPGFGIPAAELPSIVRTALRQGWVTAELNVTPDHDTGKFVQDRTVLTGGIPLEASLFDGILFEDEDEPNRPFVTTHWDRPEALDQLGPPSAGTPFNLATLRECLLTADKLIAANPDSPRFGVLELTNGFASAGTLNLRFCIEAPGLAGTDLRLHQAQLRPLAVLLDRFNAEGATHVATSHQHIFTDGLTSLYATIQLTTRRRTAPRSSQAAQTPKPR